MPDVRNCKRCGKLYNYIGGPMLCPICLDKDEEDFKRIKDYLYENPGASMAEISSVLEISTEKITRFLREGRLEIINNENNLILECESCGRPIKTGRYCDDCAREMREDLKKTARNIKASFNTDTSKESEGVGMRYLYRNKKELE